MIHVNLDIVGSLTLYVFRYKYHRFRSSAKIYAMKQSTFSKFQTYYDQMLMSI